MVINHSADQALRFDDVLLDSRVLQAWIHFVETIATEQSTEHDFDDCRVLVTDKGGIQLIFDTAKGQMHSFDVEPECWEYRQELS